jgi:DNA-directed RNA polymerase subunit RPC12/RpoP
MTLTANFRGMEQIMDTANVLMTIGGIAVAVAAIAALRKRNVANGECRAAAAETVDAYRRARDKADLGLVCPVCSGVAEPMRDTQDQYRCVQCGHEFVDVLNWWMK